MRAKSIALNPNGKTNTFAVLLMGSPQPVIVFNPLGGDFDRVVALRRAEADEFYRELTPAAATADEAMVMRQAFAGMLWSKQLYAYDVSRWLDGDPAEPPPPPGRRTVRNSRWGNFNAFDIMSMPDKWEYPWFAAWDLAFHCVALAHVDPAFAKYQLILVCREWFQHPSGASPAYEWDFGDVNPPVQAWAALEVGGILAAKRRARLPGQRRGSGVAAGQDPPRIHRVGRRCWGSIRKEIGPRPSWSNSAASRVC